MDCHSANFLFQLLETLPDGIILFQNNAAFYANRQAKKLTGTEPVGKSLFYLLGNTDAELLEKDSNNNTVFYLLIDQCWVSATLSEYEGQTAMLVLREDTDVYVEPMVCPVDEDDLAWLRMIAAKISILSDADQTPPPTLTAELRRYTAMLHKYINNAFLRSMTQPEFDPFDDLAYFSFADLLDHAVAQIGDSLSSVGIALEYTGKHELHDAHVRGYVRHFLMLVYNALDIMIYHCREASPLRQLVLSEGASQSHLFIRLSAVHTRPFPTSVDLLNEYQREKPDVFTPAYAASVKLVISVVKLYKGMIVSNTSDEKTDTLFCFPKDYAKLASPYDFSSCAVYPGIELSDTLYDSSFTNGASL